MTSETNGVNFTTSLDSWITAHLAEVTGIPAQKWTPEILFEDVGLESLAITAFTARVSPTFPGLRKTFLFECRCIADVCNYLRDSFAQEVAEIEGAVRNGAKAPVAHEGVSTSPVKAAAQPLDKREQSGRIEAGANSASNTGILDTRDTDSEDDAWPEIQPFSNVETSEVMPSRVRRHEPIAIIGMSGVFPESETLDEFWQHLEQGADLVGEVPADRWPMEGFFEPGTSSRNSGKSYSKWGAFVKDVDRFDSQFFGISPKEAKHMDPQERVFLQTAYHAMEDAALVGARGKKFGSDIGVFVGITTNTNQLNGPDRWRQGEADIPTAMPWSAANRVSYNLNLSGPSLAVDTACSSSLVAIHMAVESLQRGECSAAITGGVNLYLHPSKYVLLCQQQMLSPTGRCHSFGEEADGFVPGEGAGVVVLKPLSKAQEDGDRIRAVISGSSTNHSGRTNGYTVPSSSSQVQLINKALDVAGLKGSQINYVEAHGTGTKLGDPIEVAALSDALSADVAEQECAVGSIKTNIGHLESAAGIAGLIKVVLQMERGRIAPSLHSRNLSSQLQIEGTRFHVPQRGEHWPHGPDGRRRAGLSSFGAGGTCAHVIVEDHARSSQSSHRQQGPYIFPISAATDAQLRDVAESLLAFMTADPARPDDGPQQLDRIAYTLQCGRAHHRSRAALIAHSQRTFVDELTSFLEKPFAVSAGQTQQHDIAQRWVDGESINWLGQWSLSPEPISIPLYPFLKEFHKPARLIDPIARDVTSLEDRSKVERPRVKVVDRKDVDDVLRAHRVHDKGIMPGTGYMCAALQLVGSKEKFAPLTLRDIRWEVPLTDANRSSDELQLSETLHDDGRDEIVGMTGTTIHFRVNVDRDLPRAPVRGLALDDIRARCGRSSDVRVAYDAFERIGLTYGPSFRRMLNADVGHNEAFVEVVADPMASVQRYQLTWQAGFWDSIFQSVFFALEDGVSSLRVPFSVKRLTWFANLTERVVVHVIRQGSAQPDREEFNLTVAQPDGRVLAEIEGLTYKSARRSVGAGRAVPSAQTSAQSLADLQLVTSDWVASDDGVPGRKYRPSRALVFGAAPASIQDRENVADVDLWYASQFDGFNFDSRHTVEMDFRRADHFSFLWQCLEKTGALPDAIAINTDAIADLPASEKSDAPQPASNALQAVVDVLRSVFQAYAPSKPCRIAVLSTCPMRSRALGGLLRTVAVEQPALSFRVITAPTNDANIATPARLLSELENFSDERSRRVCELRWEPGQQIYTQRRMQVGPFESNGRELQKETASDGVIVITGGAGALGSKIAEHVAQTSTVKIALLGRSAENGKTQTALNAIVRHGRDAAYWATDVSDVTALRRTLYSVRQKFGPITGLVHCAGQLKDGLFNNTTVQDWDTVMLPKIAAAQALDVATQDDPLSWFVICSGLAGHYGNPGQGLYACANAWLDAFAEDREQRVATGLARGTTRSIAWPLWDTEDGMQASAGLKAQIAAAGLSLLEDKAGLAVFEQSLGLSAASCAPVPGSLEAVRKVFSGTEQPQATGDARRRSKDTAGRLQAGERVQVRGSASSNPAHRKELVLALLTKAISDVTETDPSRVDVHASLDVFGLDSILVMDISSKLDASFPTLAKTALFEARSIINLCDLILDEHPEDVDLLMAATEPDDNRADVSFGEGESQQEQFGRPSETYPEQEKDVKLPNTSSTTPSARGEGLRPNATAEDHDIAIVGLAGRYPGSENLQEFWTHLAEGHDLITELPERLKSQISVRDVDAGLYAKWGSFLDDIECFDPLFFGISPRDAERIDPQERLFLQTAWHALEDAGYTPESLSGLRGNGDRCRVGVTVGVMYGEYQFYGAEHGASKPPTLANSSYASIANRVSYCFDFDGPSFAVDSMCSSSFTSIHLAIQLIRSGDCDAAIAGGVNLSLHPYKYRTLCDLKFAASDGHCRSFGEGGDGYVPGEGVGAVLLKPLSAALEDGDHVYAVVKGSGVGHGARTSGYTVPNAEAQASVIAKAFDRSGLSPSRLSYVEAHGTGTSLGDPIEIRGLSKALGSKLSPGQKIPIGSVKSNIGHLESAAGIASLTKALMQFRFNALVPSIHSETLNPNIDFDRSPFKVQTDYQAWTKMDGLPRVASVSAFGAGGSNAHLVIEEFESDNETRGLSRQSAHDEPLVFVLSAESGNQLRELAEHHFEFLTNDKTSQLAISETPSETLRDIAMTLFFGRRHCSHRLAIVARSLAGYLNALKSFLDAAGSNLEDGLTTPDFSWFVGQVETDENVRGGIAGALVDEVRSWVSGGSFQPDTSKPWRRVSLPGYVFKKRRYWIEEAIPSVQQPKQEAPPVVSIKGRDVSRPQLQVKGFQAKPSNASQQKANGVREPVKPVNGVKTKQPALAPDEILHRVKLGQLEAGAAREMLRKMLSSN